MPSKKITLRVDESLLDHVRTEVAGEQIKRNMERTMAREYATGRVELRLAHALRQGDYLLATDHGKDFYRSARILSIKPSEPDQRADLWMNVAYLEGGTGGSALQNDELLLTERP